MHECGIRLPMLHYDIANLGRNDDTLMSRNANLLLLERPIGTLEREPDHARALMVLQVEYLLIHQRDRCAPWRYLLKSRGETAMRPTLRVECAGWRPRPLVLLLANAGRRRSDKERSKQARPAVAAATMAPMSNLSRFIVVLPLDDGRSLVSRRGFSLDDASHPFAGERRNVRSCLSG